MGSARLSAIGSIARASVWCAAWLSIGASAVSAQPADSTPPAPRVQHVNVTPFVSLGSDFSSRIGASVAFDLGRDVSIETEVGYRNQEISAMSGSVNLLYALPRLKRLAPYAAAGIGLEQYGVALDVPRFGVITQRRVGMSTSLGGGLRIPVTDRWDYRSDVRWLNPWGDTPEGWRIYNGASLRVGR